MGEILRAENISKTYQAGRVVVKALNRCSFSVERGEFVAVVGRSGSGKSTLLRILASFDKPDEGKVYVEGEEISGLKGKKLAQFRQEKIGFIYQDYTAYENVLLPLKIAHQAVDKEQLERLFEELGITDCRERYPDEMSGGQKQRVAIARALVTRPAVLLADEPTGNLDAENAESVAAILSRASMRYGQTIVMVTHDRQMADYADRILSMENIVACMK
jgi:putative ABC transport system ATP-binding protein